MKTKKVYFIIIFVIMLIAFILNTETIELNFLPIEKLDLNVVNEKYIEIVKKKFIYNYPVYFYSKEMNNENDVKDLYAGIKINDDLYEVGSIGYEHYLDTIFAEVIEIEETNFFKFNGALGAAYPIVYLVAIENDKPKIIINKELSIFLIDLDSNSELELISSYSGITAIYKQINNEWNYVSINKTLNEDNVRFDEKNYLFISEKGNYRFKNNKLLKVILNNFNEK